MSGILCLVFGLSIATLANAAAQPTVLATFNTQLAIQSVEEGKKAHALLKKELDDQKKKIETAGKKVQASYEEYQKQAMVLDEKARRDREEKIQNDMMEVRKMEQEAQNKFAKRDQEVSQPILIKMREVVAKVAKEKGYTMVIDGNEAAVVYMQPGDDLTQEVIKRYDSKK